MLDTEQVRYCLLGKKRIFEQMDPSKKDDPGLAGHAAMKRDVSMRFIDAALERIRTGDYGICVDCNEAIPAPRLELVPGATRCFCCQQENEK